MDPKVGLPAVALSAAVQPADRLVVSGRMAGPAAHPRENREVLAARRREARVRLEAQDRRHHLKAEAQSRHLHLKTAGWKAVAVETPLAGWTPALGRDTAMARGSTRR